MHEHHLAPTTHTAELEQIREINLALAGGRRVAAGSVGLGTVLPDDAVLRWLEAEGSPSYPYIFGHFSPRGSADIVRIELHTAQLRAISNHLSLRSHIWGAGLPAKP